MHGRWPTFSYCSLPQWYVLVAVRSVNLVHEKQVKDALLVVIGEVPYPVRTPSYYTTLTVTRLETYSTR